MAERVNLLSPELRANPYPYYAEMRRTSPVCQVDPGGLWAVSRYDDVAFVLKRSDLFSSDGLREMATQPGLEHNPMAGSLIVMDPPAHTRTRAIVARAFASRVIPRIEPLVRAVAQGFIARLSPGRELDFCAALATPLPATVIADLLGLDPSLRDRFRRWADDLVSVNAGATPERIASIRQTVADLERYLGEVLAERRAAPRDDLASDLLAAQIEGVALTEPDIIAFLFLLLTAGLETTSHLLTNAALILIERPEVAARLRAEPGRIPDFIEEVLRFDSPVHGSFRRALADVEIAGVKLPAGTLVTALIGSANRDESQFPAPDRFDIDRPRPTSMAFGHGVHFCLGAALARAEAKIGLEELIALPGRFERTDRELTWNRSMTVRGPEACWVRYVA